MRSDSVSGTERAVAEALWAKVAEDLAADTPHQAFLAHCTDHDMLDEAARRYREKKDELDEDDPLREVLDKRLAGIATLAMAKLDDGPAELKPSPVLRILQVFIITFTVFSFLLLAWALSR